MGHPQAVERVAAAPQRTVPRALRRFSVVVLAIAMLALACNGENSEPTNGPSPQATEGGNVFLNPGLEDGDDPWFSLKPEEGPFIRTSDLAHSGQYSAKFEMRDPADAQDAKVYYLVQEIAPEEFPEFLSGYYRVEQWQKGTTKQYLQFVVIAFGADNLPGGFPNHQIRYILAGIDSPPFPIGNAHFLFLGRDEPVLGEWVRFEANVREDFERLWGTAPESFEGIRILFEVRWDDKQPGQAALADVYYDDLYFGPAGGDAESDT